MISTSNVKQALKIDVALSGEMSSALQLWTSMYLNQADWLSGEIKSLNLAAAIASEISRAVTIEMETEITGSPRADYLYEQMESALKNIRQMTEYGVAKGGLMMKPYVKSGKISVDFVQADQFYPVAFDANGNIISCVFSDSRQIGQTYYTRLEHHAMDGNSCVITNAAFKSNTVNVLGNPCNLSEIDAWADLESEATITGIDRPLFAYFKYPTANNIDPASPLGVSAYARATDLIKQADEQWSNFLWEFDSGKRALYVDTLAFGKDSSNKPILPNKRLYRTLNQGSAIGSDNLFEDWSPTLREVNILNGLDAILKKIEFNCGLAYGTLSDPNIEAATATEIKMQKQRSYATITDTQAALEDALNQLLYAMDTWVTIAKLAPNGKYDAVFYFDDSVVVDHDILQANAMQEVGSGLMSKVEYRMVVKGETEEIARKYLAMVAKEQPPVDFFAGDGGL
jgi:A118 family predicted phage portal protein